MLSLQLQNKSAHSPARRAGRGARAVARAEIIPVRPDSDNADVGMRSKLYTRKNVAAVSEKGTAVFM